MKFTLEEAHEFGWEGLKGYAYNSAEEFPRASAAIFEVNDEHGKVKTTTSDRVYLILEGEGEFEIDGETIGVEESDVIIVPNDTPYNYRATDGKLKLFLVHTPAYDPEAEVQLD